MSETNFLPGNWTVHDRMTCGEGWAVGSDHDFPGRPPTTHKRYVAQMMTKDDAHLVSAAKELYDALLKSNELLAVLFAHGDSSAQQVLIRNANALGKARGEIS